MVMATGTTDLRLMIRSMMEGRAGVDSAARVVVEEEILTLAYLTSKGETDISCQLLHSK